MKTFFRICGFILLLALALSVSAQDYEIDLEYVDCPFPLPEGEIEGETIECAYLSVPEDRTDPDGTYIWLAVAILYSHADDPLPDPILYLEGGPGGSALSSIDMWVDSPLRAQRDIILYDQRGTGYSQPYLGCLVDDEGIDDEFELVRLCRDQLVLDGVNLNAYNSAASAADIRDLRTALEIDEWNLVGISYGTRLALTAMRDHPAGIRSVVLDSVYPPQIQAYEEQSPLAVRALDALFAACAADAACNTAYPNLESRFYATYEDWNRAPLADEDDEEITGDDLLGMLIEALYDTEMIPYLPLAITLAWEGEYDEALELLAGAEEDADELEDIFTPAELAALRQSFTDAQIADIARLLFEDLDDDEYDELIGQFSDAELDLIDDVLELDMDDEEGEEVDLSDSDGMNNSVECYEEIPFNDYDRALALVDQLPAPLREKFAGDVENIFVSCEIWDIAAADAIENEPVFSEIPALVLAGAFDPVTPPAWAEAAADHLPNGYYFLFPNAGHGIMDINDCAVSIYAQFMDDPTTAPDGTCAAGLPVEWVIR